MPTTQWPWQIGDRDNQRLRIGDKVNVIDKWSPVAVTKGVCMVTGLSCTPHHLVHVTFTDDSEDWILAGLVVLEPPAQQ